MVCSKKSCMAASLTTGTASTISALGSWVIGKSKQIGVQAGVAISKHSELLKPNPNLTLTQPCQQSEVPRVFWNHVQNTPIQ
jgi:hypothetical protein